MDAAGTALDQVLALTSWQPLETTCDGSRAATGYFTTTYTVVAMHPAAPTNTATPGASRLNRRERAAVSAANVPTSATKVTAKTWSAGTVRCTTRLAATAAIPPSAP